MARTSVTHAAIGILGLVPPAFQRHLSSPLGYFPAAYQSNTRKARSVFHRLGSPSPSSTSTGILPGYWTSSDHRPSPSRFDATSSIASATRSSGVAPALRKYSSPRSTS